MRYIENSMIERWIEAELEKERAKRNFELRMRVMSREGGEQTLRRMTGLNESERREAALCFAPVPATKNAVPA